ncbi:hypothetical protein KAM546c_37080 [Enterobacter roggenkampii]|nr:hypothetical protein R1TS_38950 [Enterobacter cloacae]BDS22447.1 hypothetical protein KAM546c_37080 [Enterobacter roggenkampii]
MFSFMAFNAELKGSRVMQWIHDKQMANRYGKIASLQYIILLSHPNIIVSVITLSCSGSGDGIRL